MNLKPIGRFWFQLPCCYSISLLLFTEVMHILAALSLWRQAVFREVCVTHVLHISRTGNGWERASEQPREHQAPVCLSLISSLCLSVKEPTSILVNSPQGVAKTACQEELKLCERNTSWKTSATRVCTIFFFSPRWWSSKVSLAQTQRNNAQEMDLLPSSLKLNRLTADPY